MGTKWAVGALVTAGVLIIMIIGPYDSHKRQVLMEQGIAQAEADSAQYARVEKAAQQAKEAEEKKKFDELPTASKARINFGKVIEAAYQSDGRRMSVSATGDKFDTLELSSALIFEGSHTLAAAEEILGSETMKMAKQLKFKRIEIKGTRYSVPTV